MTKLYCKDSKNRIRIWEIKVEGGQYAVRDGLLEGKLKDWVYTECKQKNVGKANETSLEEQAELEAEALVVKKLKKKYFYTAEAAEDSNVFSPMLAKELTDKIEINEDWCSQTKLDGIRATAIKDGKTKLLSRERRDIVSCVHIQKILDGLDFNFYIDGELYNHQLKDNFNKLVSLIRKEKNITEKEYKDIEESVQYHVYDAYFPKQPDLPFKERYRLVSELFKGVGDSIVVVPIRKVTDRDSMVDIYEEYLEDGYEGQILRKLDSKYKVAGRSKDLIKHKPVVDEEFEIIDILPGIGGWSGIAKRVRVRVDGEEVGCGIRGDREYLREVLINKADYIGKLATVEYFGRTRDNSLRFPVVKTLDRIG